MRMTTSSINRLLIKVRDIGAVNRLAGSGWPRTALTEENVDLVNDLVLSLSWVLMSVVCLL